MKRRPELEALVEKHRLLDRSLECGREYFLSDWNCNNPFIQELLGPELASHTRDSASAESYVYFDDAKALLDAIGRFHCDVEGLSVSRSNVLAGPGSSSFLATISIWLRRSGYTEVYYLPPLYHTLHFLLQSLDITATPVSASHAFEEQHSMRLPSQHTVLLMCDPVWYAGKFVPSEHIAAIADWQSATRSLVFVDGSFQYMGWHGPNREATAALNPELTFRLISPAKALAAPSYRFAYLLHPAATHDELVFLYESTTGGASASDLAFAYQALRLLADGSTNRVMPDYFKGVYATLVERNIIRTTIVPECGYFVFAIPVIKPAGLVAMDQSYFELKGYPDYCRINLMAARRIYASEAWDAQELAIRRDRD